MNICEKCNEESVFLILMEDGRKVCSYCCNEEQESLDKS